MFFWALTFLAVAVFSALLGYGGLAGPLADMARVCFLVFLVAFAASLLFGRRPPLT